MTFTIRRVVGRVGFLICAAAVACSPAQPAPSGGAQPGPAAPEKELVFRYPIGNPRTLDPGLATDSVSTDVLTKLFDGLVTQNYDGTIAPQLAERWESSTDATRFTFTLRSGAKWSDGKPVVAGDFEYAIKRVLDPKTASEYANALYAIKGARAFHQGQGAVSGVQATARDDRTLVVETEEPAAHFLAIASTWTMAAVRKDAIDKGGARWTEVGTILTSGPFLLKEFKQDQTITLVRNEEYWGTKPKLARIEYRIFPDGPDQQNAILRSYENDELDAMGTYAIPPSEVDRVLKDPKLSKEVLVYERSSSTWLCLNNGKAPFSDVRVRKALGLSLQRQLLIENVLKSISKPAEGVVPPGITGRNPSAWPKEDLIEAKRLLSDAGFPDGRGFPAMTFTYNSNTSNKTLAEYLQGRWKDALGIEVKIEAMDFAVFQTFRRGNKTYDSFICIWGSDYEDPANWYNQLFTPEGDEANFTTSWRNAEAQGLMKRAGATPNADERKRLYEQADAAMARDYPFIPVLYGTGRTMVKPYVENYRIKRTLGGADLRVATLTK